MYNDYVIGGHCPTIHSIHDRYYPDGSHRGLVYQTRCHWQDVDAHAWAAVQLSPAPWFSF